MKHLLPNLLLAAVIASITFTTSYYLTQKDDNNLESSTLSPYITFFDDSLIDNL